MAKNKVKNSLTFYAFHIMYFSSGLEEFQFSIQVEQDKFNQLLLEFNLLSKGSGEFWQYVKKSDLPYFKLFKEGPFDNINHVLGISKQINYFTPEKIEFNLQCNEQEIQSRVSDFFETFSQYNDDNVGTFIENYLIHEKLKNPINNELLSSSHKINKI